MKFVRCYRESHQERTVNINADIITLIDIADNTATNAGYTIEIYTSIGVTYKLNGKPFYDLGSAEEKLADLIGDLGTLIEMR